MKLEKSALFSIALILLAACSGNGTLQVQDAWARPTAAGANAAVYFQLRNGSGQDDVLLGASSDVAGAVELHQSMMMGDSSSMSDENTGDMGTSGSDSMSDSSSMGSSGDMQPGVMEMVPVDSLPLAAGESVSFEPGSYHVMLIGLNRDLVQGDSFQITLHFQNAGEMVVNAQVDQR